METARSLTENVPNGIATTQVQIRVAPLREGKLTFHLTGISPYMQCRFSEKAINKIQETHRAGQQGRSKRVREARDFHADYQGAMHLLDDGTCGIPCGAFRSALISTCRLVGFKMTIAKLSIFVIEDGLDAIDKTPLVRIAGTPQECLMPVRNATGVIDLRNRPLWEQWSVDLRIRFDLDQFSLNDIYNLLRRAGRQVGIGEGRPDSRDSNGLGYGMFDVGTPEEGEVRWQ